jgi:hypothetical protein
VQKVAQALAQAITWWLSLAVKARFPMTTTTKIKAEKPVIK